MIEFTAHAITARQQQAWQASIMAAMALGDAQGKVAAMLREMAITRGLVIVTNDPDYPLVASHDYGCEIEA